MFRFLRQLTAVLLIGVAANVAGDDGVNFLYGEAHSILHDSAASVRFYLENATTHTPVPYLDQTAFRAKTGHEQRVITSAGANADSRMEGTLAQRSFGATIYLTLLLDTSASVLPAELIAVVSAYISKLMSSRGNVFMKIVLFSGSDTTLDLTQGRSNCYEGFCNDEAILLEVIQSYAQHLSTHLWPGYDPGSTNVWGSIQNTADSLEVQAQAHADHQRQNFRSSPSAMAEYLVVFTDLNDNNGASTVEATVDKLRLAGRSQKVSLIVLPPPDYLAIDSPFVVELIEDAKVQLTAVVDLVLSCDSTDTQHVEQKFIHIADHYDIRANGWYELRMCPPARHGTNLPLILEMIDAEASAASGHFVPLDGQLETHFSAEGFGNTCPYQGDRVQAQHTSFCDTRTCGYSRAVFCGLCSVSHDTGTEHFDLMPDEALVLKVEPPPAGTSLTKSVAVRTKHHGQVTNTLPILTAHAASISGDTSTIAERVAVHAGAGSHHGVTIHGPVTSMPGVLTLSDAANALGDEVLLHVSWHSDSSTEQIDEVEVTTTWRNSSGNLVSAPAQATTPPPPAVTARSAVCDCVNGACEATDEHEVYCHCEGGWTGPRCDISNSDWHPPTTSPPPPALSQCDYYALSGASCVHGEYCVDEGLAMCCCTTGWTGPRCSTSSSPDSASNTASRTTAGTTVLIGLIVSISTL